MWFGKKLILILQVLLIQQSVKSLPKLSKDDWSEDDLNIDDKSENSSASKKSSSQGSSSEGSSSDELNLILDPETTTEYPVPASTPALESNSEPSVTTFSPAAESSTTTTVFSTEPESTSDPSGLPAQHPTVSGTIKTIPTEHPLPALSPKP